MPLIFATILIAAIAFVAVVAVGKLGQLDDPPSDRPGPWLPEGQLRPADLFTARFPIVVRGYRMDQVDSVLQRAAAELAARDDEIAALRRGMGESEVPMRDNHSEQA